MTTKEKIKVMQAYTEGKTILIKCMGDWSWSEAISEPEWNWEFVEYKVKPEPKIRPYHNVQEMLDLENLLDGPTWLRNKNDGDISLLTNFRTSSNEIFVDYSWWDMKHLLENFEYLDGSPCGVGVVEMI